MRVMTNSPISFPGLFGDWEFTAGEVALDIGKGIYWYGIIIAFGVIAAVALCLRLKHRFGLTEDNLLDLVLLGVPASIVGARIYYVVFYLDLYRTADGGIDCCHMGRRHCHIRRDYRRIFSGYSVLPEEKAARRCRGGWVCDRIPCGTGRWPLG